MGLAQCGGGRYEISQLKDNDGYRVAYVQRDWTTGYWIGPTLGSVFTLDSARALAQADNDRRLAEKALEQKHSAATQRMEDCHG